MGERHGAVEDVVMFGGVYRGRRVLVTGHTGFKGAWLSEWLLRLGAEVSGYALTPSTEPNLFDAAGIADRMTHVVADVRDADRLLDVVTGARPDVVFHLAAQPIVRQGYTCPRETFEINALGTVNLLEAVRACDAVRAVVVVTSDKCYRNPEDGTGFREPDPLGGDDPYSASKACEEIVATCYAASYLKARGTRLATARAGNVIGGGDWAQDRLVPDCVRALVGGLPVMVREPDAVRPWQHVLESLAGYLLLGESLLLEGDRCEGAWNFGPARGDSGLPVRWVVERFIEAWGDGAWLPDADGAGPREARLLVIDSTKAKESLGWEPVWDSRTSVRRAAAWYRAFADRHSAAELIGADIGDFAADAAALGRPWAGGGDVS